MAIEIIPKKPESRLPNLQDIIFYLSVIALIVLIPGYFGLVFWENKLAKETKEAEENIIKMETPQMKTLEKQVLGQQRKIINFSAALKTHTLNSNLFDLIENLIHPKVLFSELSLSGSSALITGYAKSFEALGQQLRILREGNFVTSADLLKVGLGKEGEIQFIIELNFDPRLLEYQ